MKQRTKPEDMLTRKLFKLVDEEFSLYIRSRDGWKCVQCGSDYSPTNGHIIPRSKSRAVYFDEENCHCQCWPCNKAHTNRPQKYIAWFIKKFGGEAFVALEERSRQKTKQWRKPELLTLLAAIRFKRSLL